MGLSITSASRARSALRRARANPEVLALAGLLLVGVLLRVYFTIEWRPAITGYSDSGIYFQDAQTGPFADPFRTVGYGMFLSVLHAVTPHLLLVTFAQHVIGLATGVLLFLIVRRAGGPVWLGLVPAAFLILNGDQLFLEHAALTETLFTFLVTLAIYGAVRGSGGAVLWAALAGVSAGLSVTVREAGLVLVPIFVLWLVFANRRPTRRTLIKGGVALAATLIVLGGYAGWRSADTGLSGLTTNDAWNLYGRVAPFADCTKFVAPTGTEQLCESTPPETRANDNAYIFNPTSPAQQMFGPPYYVSAVPDAMGKLRSWSLAAIRGQPLDYLSAVGDDLVRLIDTNHPSKGDLSADDFIAFLLGGPDMRSGRNDFVAYWQGRLYPHDHLQRGDMGVLKGYEKTTRVDGVLMAVLLVLMLASIWIVPGPARSVARLLVAVATALLVGPILTKGYDFRFTVPAIGSLSAAAALGGWGVSAWWRRRSGASTRGLPSTSSREPAAPAGSGPL